MNPTRFLGALWASIALAVPAAAQDSVSKSGCLPGDALAPWSGASQRKDYVVDLAPFVTDWGSAFGVAPLVKSSKSSSSFFSSVIGAQGISRRQRDPRPLPAAAYAAWLAQAGAGVNGDPAKNDPAQTVDVTQREARQFAVFFNEFGTTDFAVSYQGATAALVGVDPSEPTRLYVSRIQAAVNACDEQNALSTIYGGGIDEDGNFAFRTDGFGIANPGCGLNPFLASPADHNLFLVDVAGRNTSIPNVISNDFVAGGLFDKPATRWLVRNSTTTYNVPNVGPESVFGAALALGSNFNNQYVRGPDFGAVSETSSHLAAGLSGHRGNVSVTTRNHALLSSTQGMAAAIGISSGSGMADSIAVWGLGAGGAVTGTLKVTLPAMVTDNSTGFTNLGPGTNELDHYHSQTAFQGGNGQIAINVDPAGNLLLAAEVDHPTTGTNQHAINYLAVARVAPNGQVAWTMAGYQDGGATQGGKPIVDPFGNVLGEMVEMARAIPGQNGPSVSSPMIDAGGNVWFLAAIDDFTTGTAGVALLRAVYDAQAFSYRLERVLRMGDVFAGPNSGRSWRLTNLRINDADSVSSSTAFSGNASEHAHLGIPGAALAAADARQLGGLVLAATVTYDRDEDGVFTDCSTTPGSLDETYETLLYVAPVEGTGAARYGQGCAGAGGFVPTLDVHGFVAPGATVEFSLEKGLGASFAVVFIGAAPAQLPTFPPCTLNVFPILSSFTAPLLGSGPGNGELQAPVVLPALPQGLTFTVQAFVADPSTAPGYSNTNGVQLTVQ